MTGVHAIEVLEGGFLTTVQDLGRYGYQRYGVPVSGAMDQFALRTAQRLIAEPPSAAGLEITLQGPSLRFLLDTVIAVTGADLDVRLDGAPLAAWRAVPVPAGSTLTFGRLQDGMRAYLAVAGGIEVPLVLGSRSTFTRTSLGGFRGRALRAGDTLAVAGVPDAVAARALDRRDVPRYAHDHTLRVVLGPQDEAFTAAGLATFLSSTYVVTPQSDRIGYRLAGPTVQHVNGPDIVSDGAPFGAVQVAGDGLPIVLMADRGTTGGYTKIATVISADLPRLAQSAPGDRVRFAAVSVDQAQHALREQEAILDRLARSPGVDLRRRRLEVVVDDRRFVVTTGFAAREPGTAVDPTPRDIDTASPPPPRTDESHEPKNGSGGVSSVRVSISG